jgi:hypothetical protein
VPLHRIFEHRLRPGAWGYEARYPGAEKRMTRRGLEMSRSSFDSFFTRAVGAEPFPYQRRLAEAPRLPNLVHARTNARNTADLKPGASR